MQKATRRFLGQPADGNAAAGIDLVIADRSAALVELLGKHLAGLGFVVDATSDPAEAIAFARNRSQNPPDMVLVDLLFPQETSNGLDVLMAFKKWCPESTLVIYTSATHHEAPLLRAAWESIGAMSVLSKLAPVSTLVETVDRILESGLAEVDPQLQALLPAKRSPWRTVDSYRRLVPHAGHAKLWRSLLEHCTAPSYRLIAEGSNLSVNTIRNYRHDLLAELRLHGLDNPTMQEMHEFAHTVRPLLSPVLIDHLADESVAVGGRCGIEQGIQGWT